VAAGGALLALGTSGELRDGRGEVTEVTHVDTARMHEFGQGGTVHHTRDIAGEDIEGDRGEGDRAEEERGVSDRLDRRVRLVDDL
jgi:hypothetical protein